MSTKPVTASAASESGSHFESPKTIIPAPKIATTTSSVGPAGRAERLAREQQRRDERADRRRGAQQRRARPARRGGSTARTPARARSSRRAARRRGRAPIAPSSIRVAQMKRTPATRLSQPGGSVVTSERTDRPHREDGDERRRRGARPRSRRPRPARSAKMMPPSAGPAIDADLAGDAAQGDAPGQELGGTSSGVSARERGLADDVRDAGDGGEREERPERCRARRASRRAAATAIAMFSASATAVTARRGSRSASWPAGSASSGSGRNSIEPDEPEVERVVVDRVDLPADRDREHLLRRSPFESERRPEEREVADPQRGRQASPHASAG